MTPVYQNSSFDQIQTAISDRMKQAKLHQLVIDDFLLKTKKVYHGETGQIDFGQILNLNSDDIIDLNSLDEVSINDIKPLLEQTVIIKLNGGLGTSMGLQGPKTLLPVHNNFTFLDIILLQLKRLRQLSGIEIPLIFMNSFSTNELTLQSTGIKNLNSKSNLPESFLQNKIPRLNQSTLLPIGDGNSQEDWCPPGHGDLFLSLEISGLLDKLLAQNKRYAFISNGDNLGAVFHSGILSEFAKRNLHFLSEVTQKSNADIKGGVLFRHRSTGRIELLETAQVPAENKIDFEDTKRFSDFNINNLWVDLFALKKRLNSGPIDLPLIVNPKTVNDQKIIQLESAMGAAIGRFEIAAVIRVNRNRFSPVKNCSDLMVRRSDACFINDAGALILHPDRKGIEPVVHLDDAYKFVDDFDDLVPVVPSLIKCNRLTVKGAIRFDAPADIEGTVTLENPMPTAVSITQLK